MNRRRNFRFVLAAAICGVIGAGSARAQVILADIWNDYTATGLPSTDTFGSGNWNYYASTTQNPLTGTLSPLSYLSIGNAGNSGYGLSGHDGYSVPAVSNLPIFGDGAPTGVTRSLAWHPGDSSPTFTVLRWTAAASEAGPIQIKGNFSRAGEPGGPVDFSIFVNGVQGYAQASVPQGGTYVFDFTSTIASGQSVDFVLGPSSGGFGGDESLINGGISTVPEPSTFAALVVGLVALGLAARRRRRASPPAVEDRAR